MINGGLEAGKNRVLTLARNGYIRASFNPRNALDVLTYARIWKNIAKHPPIRARGEWWSVSIRDFSN